MKPRQLSFHALTVLFRVNFPEASFAYCALLRRGKEFELSCYFWIELMFLFNSYLHYPSPLSLYIFCQAYGNNEKIMNSNDVKFNFSELRV